MSLHFYKELPALNMSIAEVFSNSSFCNIPNDWYIIIADIMDSTEAVRLGRHNDVNLAAAGSLVAALNIARTMDVEIPFFFGGDGGTVLIPSELLQPVMIGLMLHNLNSKKNFGLEFHIGSLSVREVIESGHSLQIAKLQSGNNLNKAIIIGDGLRFAEKMIKQSAKEKSNESVVGELNLEGLECRWDKIKPPLQTNEIVCYLIEATEPAAQLEIYRDVLLKIDEIYGSIEKRNPLSLNRLKLLLSFQKIKKEMMVKYGKWKANYFTSAYLRTLVGRLFFRFNKTSKELKELQYEYKSMKSEVMFRSKQSELAKAVAPLGLKELVQPPVILKDSAR